MSITQERKPRIKSAWKLSSLLLLLSCSAPVATRSPASRHQPTLLSIQSAEPCGEPGSIYKAPGHKPGSKKPWVFFLGNAAHEAITHVYGVYHPTNIVYYNSVGIRDIVRKERIGDDSRLLENERKLRPDITDVTLSRVMASWAGQTSRARSCSNSSADCVSGDWSGTLRSLE